MLETSFTFPEARATAVSAMTSALMDPNPPVALVLIKLSSTTSSRSVICQKGKKNSRAQEHANVIFCIERGPKRSLVQNTSVNTCALQAVHKLSKLLLLLK